MAHSDLADSSHPEEGRPATARDSAALATMLRQLDDLDRQPVVDCVSGVRLRRAATWRAAAKVVRCGGAPYYEYNEVAASTITSGTLQYLRMLRAVPNNDPANPDISWNRGHLRYQVAYASGPVNFYYRRGSESTCVPLGTGDSLFSLPFLPHSFAARDTGEPAYVVVLAYPGGLLGNARQELSALGYDAARGFAMVSGSDSYAALLWSFLDAWAIPPTEMLRQTDLPADRFAAILSGKSAPSPTELESFARVLSINVRDLLPLETRTHNGVHVVRVGDAVGWLYPDEAQPAYRIRRLASDPVHPHTTAIELQVLRPDDGERAWLTTYQHQYVYVLGESGVRFRWQGAGAQYVTRLGPGDVVYVQPGVPITFGTTTGPSPKLLLLRTVHAMSTDLRFAIGTMPEDGLLRYCSGSQQRYPDQRIA